MTDPGFAKAGWTMATGEHAARAYITEATAVPAGRSDPPEASCSFYTKEGSEVKDAL